MYIAQQLKERNIAEYLIYMWQVEDLIRANDLDMDKIERNIIAQYRGGEELRSELRVWYKGLIDMMRAEHLTEKGHLRINTNVITHLTELHDKLLSSTQFPFYNSAYYKALPFIVELRKKNENKDDPELKTCFEALYGVMMLRLQKKTISVETTKAIETISNLLSLLANYYDKEQRGEIPEFLAPDNH